MHVQPVTSASLFDDWGASVRVKHHFSELQLCQRRSPPAGRGRRVKFRRDCAHGTEISSSPPWHDVKTIKPHKMYSALIILCVFCLPPDWQRGHFRSSLHYLECRAVTVYIDEVSLLRYLQLAICQVKRKLQTSPYNLCSDFHRLKIAPFDRMESVQLDEKKKSKLFFIIKDKYSLLLLRVNCLVAVLKRSAHNEYEQPRSLLRVPIGLCKVILCGQHHHSSSLSLHGGHRSYPALYFSREMPLIKLHFIAVRLFSCKMVY